MKLLARILSGWFTSGHYTLEVPVLKKIRTVAKEAFAVDVQNVSDWFDDLYPVGAKLPALPEICPLWKLPFPVMWFEFEGASKQFGALVHAPDEDDDSEPDDILMDAFMYAPQGKDKNAKFIACVTGEPRNDQALSRINIRIGSEDDTDKETANRISDELYANNKFGIIVNSFLYPVAASVAFFHCKNVQIKHSAAPSKQSRKAKRRTGIIVPSFHTIEVHKRTVHALSSSEPQSSRGPAPAAFVRGHFKNFTGDSKLFGKKNGIWFWSMHVRGEGAPVKSDYRTWPPEHPHTKTCIVQIEPAEEND